MPELVSSVQHTSSFGSRYPTEDSQVSKDSHIDSLLEITYGHLDVHGIFFRFPSNSPLLGSKC
jgi:hypothetical protein